MINNIFHKSISSFNVSTFGIIELYSFNFYIIILIFFITFHHGFWKYYKYY